MLNYQKCDDKFSFNSNEARERRRSASGCDSETDVHLRVICYDETVRKLDHYYGIGEFIILACMWWMVVVCLSHLFFGGTYWLTYSSLIHEKSLWPLKLINKCPVLRLSWNQQQIASFHFSFLLFGICSRKSMLSSPEFEMIGLMFNLLIFIRCGISSHILITKRNNTGNKYCFPFLYPVKRQLLQNQSISLGIFPSTSRDHEVADIRTSIYCAASIWSLFQAYRLGSATLLFLGISVMSCTNVRYTFFFILYQKNIG